MGIFAQIKRALRIGSRINGSTSKGVLYVDSSKQLANDASYLAYNDSTKCLGVGVANPTSSIHIPLENDAVTPSFAFGDGDSGFYEFQDDYFGIAVGGAFTWGFDGTYFGGYQAGKPTFIREDASATNPNIVPNFSDVDTGLGSAAADQLSLISGGSEGQRITETTLGNNSLQHTLNGQLGQATGDEVAFSFPYTVNKATSGNDTGIQLNMTDTASPGTSLLLDLQVGGGTKFKVDNLGSLTAMERSSDPADPAEGSFVLWMSDGAGSGDDGDIMIKITAASTTKTITLVDFSTF